MPTVFRVGPYRFFFYANDKGEPKHIPVERDACKAKFWLYPMGLATNHGFHVTEISKIYRIFSEKIQLLDGCWNEFFDS